MPDYGAIGISRKPAAVMPLAVWSSTNATVRAMTTAGPDRPKTRIQAGAGSYRFGGTVKVNGVAVVGAPVLVYHRPTGSLLCSVKSDGMGAFAVSGFDPVTEYFALAFPPGENAQVFANLTPEL